MEQWLRDALAEEQGYVICPLAPKTYTICDEKCEECEYEIEFKKCLERVNDMEGSRVFIKIQLKNNLKITDTGYLESQYLLEQLIQNEHFTKKRENVMLRLDNILYDNIEIKSAYLDIKNEFVILNLKEKAAYCEEYYQELIGINIKLQEENKELKKDIKNMYDKEVVISIISDEFNLTRSEVLRLLEEEED